MGNCIEGVSDPATNGERGCCAEADCTMRTDERTLPNGRECKIEQCDCGSGDLSDGFDPSSPSEWDDFNFHRCLEML